jgi:YD repeat-containing protein
MQINRAPFWNHLVTLCAMLLAAFPTLACNVAYTYDELNRLTGAVDGDGTVIEYNYDAAGNRTSHLVQAVANLTMTLAGAGTGSGTVGGSGAFAAGDPVTLAATADVGSAFAGWAPSPCAASFAMPATDLTCTATFTLNSYTVTALAGTNGRISPASQTVGHGATTTFTVTPNTGYSFTAFSGACTGASCTLSNVTEAKGVTANFSLKTYPITATANPVAGGTVTCSPNPVFPRWGQYLHRHACLRLCVHHL